MKPFQQKSGIVPYLAVAAAAFLVYANAIKGQFVFDDRDLILGNPEAYTVAKLPDHFLGGEGYHLSMGRYYRPLVSATYILDFAASEAFYNQVDSRPFHVTNILVHAAAAAIVLKLLVMLSGNLWAGLAGALIFAVHPVHTEAVAWISGRTDSLACLFFFAGFLFYLRFSQRGGWPSLAGVFLCYLAALFSKEMAVTFPAALILFDLTLGRKTAKALRPRLLVYAGLAGMTVLFLLWREHVLAIVPEREAYLYFHGKSWVAVAATQLQTLPVYGRLLVAPVNLLYHYDGTLPDQDSFLAGPVFFSLAFVAVTLAAALVLWQRRPAATFSILFFYLALVPVLNILPGQSLMAERFLYIPSLVLPVLVADLLSSVRRERVRLVLLVASGAVVILFGSMTASRNEDWKDNESLYTSAEGTPGTLLNVNLGNVYGGRGELDKAEALYREALALRPEYMDAYLNLGMLFIARGDLKAKEAARAESRGDPVAMISLRDAAQADYSRAMEFATRAREIDPRSPKPLQALAVCSMRRNMTADAIGYLEELKRLAPASEFVRKLLEELRKDVME